MARSIYSTLGKGRTVKPAEEMCRGIWHNKEVEFPRMFRGRRFSDDEVDALLAGECIRIYGICSRHSRYGVLGGLSEKVFSGVTMNFSKVSFEVLETFVQDDFYDFSKRETVMMGEARRICDDKTERLEAIVRAEEASKEEDEDLLAIADGIAGNISEDGSIIRPEYNTDGANKEADNVPNLVSEDVLLDDETQSDKQDDILWPDDSDFTDSSDDFQSEYDEWEEELEKAIHLDEMDSTEFMPDLLMENPDDLIEGRDISKDYSYDDYIVPNEYDEDDIEESMEYEGGVPTDDE